jgi:hypothetical protein
VNRFSRRTVVAVTSLLLAGAATSTTAASADSSGGSGNGVLFVHDFYSGEGSVSGNWVLPEPTLAAGQDSSPANDACYVQAQSSATNPGSLPTCTGDGTGGQPGLELTPDEDGQEGGVAWGTSVPTAEGLDITFNSYQYPSSPQDADPTPADGISFFLAASDPGDPSDDSSTVTLGPPGADLGYSAEVTNGGANGLSNAYLGVGLDVYGNFSNSSSGWEPPNSVTANCAGDGDDNHPVSNVTAQEPESLDVRGPGDAGTGYCLLNSDRVADPASGAATLDGLDGSGAPIAVPVEVAINPSASALTTANGLQVPPDGYAVSVSPVDAAASVVESGPLPNALTYAGDTSWYDSQSGLPKQLTFGWAASTGGDREVHTVSDLNVSSLFPAPKYSVALSHSPAGGVYNNEKNLTYTATPTLSGASESKEVRMTVTFPPGLNPPSSSSGSFVAGNDPSGDNWTCSTATDGQTVTCGLGPPTSGIWGVGQLPSAVIPVTVQLPTNAPSSVDTTAEVTSVDGQPSLLADDNAPVATADSLVFTNQPGNAQANASQNVKVAAEVSANKQVDTTYNGPVTVKLTGGASGAHLLGTGQPLTNSMTVNAVNGVATFPVAVDTAGFGYQLVATAVLPANGNASATSTAFDVNAVQTTCPTGQTCTTGTVTSTVPGTTAVVTEPSGQGTITASFGGNVAPIHPCTTAAPSILTFSGTTQKVIKYTYATRILNPFVCYGQPTPFINLFLQKTTYFSKTNQDYEDLLPLCLPRLNSPCISNLTWVKGSETVTIQSAVNDPHTTPSG